MDDSREQRARQLPSRLREEIDAGAAVLARAIADCEEWLRIEAEFAQFLATLPETPDRY